MAEELAIFPGKESREGHTKQIWMCKSDVKNVYDCTS